MKGCRASSDNIVSNTLKLSSTERGKIKKINKNTFSQTFLADVTELGQGEILCKSIRDTGEFSSLLDPISFQGLF